jgi:dephospho-CoA kinase
LAQTIVVDCPEELQISRTMQRSGLSEEAVRVIMAQQMPRTQRLQHASFVIHNEQGRANLQPQVSALHNHLILR